VKEHHSGSLRKALMDLFPNIGLNKSKLYKWPNMDVSSRRQYFEEYAWVEGFDPLVAANWRNRVTAVKKVQGFRHMCNFHGGYVKALTTLFPAIKL